MDLPEAKEILGRVGSAIPSARWGTELTTATQRALAALYLLNPDDDVDGQLGPRTRAAWRFFEEAAGLADPDTIDPASVEALVRTVDEPAPFVGRPKIALAPDFAFRRGQRSANRATSAAAIVEAAKARGLSREQIAYVLATAEHESAGFSTLEEFDDGTKYENRADLQNTRPGDGPRFKGRGYVQLTGRGNYTSYARITGFELVKLPTVLMNRAALSVFVIVDGMSRGAYTGRRLDEFVSAGRADFVNARRVVNGLDRAEKIAGQANEWLARLA